MAKTASEFSELLELEQSSFAKKPLDTVLRNVHALAEQIWQPPVLYGFVEHGTEHSFQVLRIALDIWQVIRPEAVYLSPLERAVLGIGALIHDIGMQYEKYPIVGQTLDRDAIRATHTELGFAMILDALSGTLRKDRKGPDLPDDEQHNLLVHLGALVGFAHSGHKYWDMIKQEYSGFEARDGGYERRLALLAALLRLGDELHLDYGRVPDLNWIGTTLLSDIETSHWCACFYTRDVTLKAPGGGSGGLRATLNWRVPLGANEPQIEDIRSLLQELREKKVSTEFKMAEECLRWSRDMEPCMLHFELAPCFERANCGPLPDSVRHHLAAQLRPYQYNVKTMPEPEGIAPLPAGPLIEACRKEAREFVTTGLGREVGHFRLRNGWHTNSYVRCRKLTSRLSFVHDLCKSLTGLYRDCGFTDVLAVGTSALPIGLHLSGSLGARFQYTFAAVEDEHSTPDLPDYTRYELDYSFAPGARVLIIDDILGVGSVIHRLVDYMNTLPASPSFMRWLCIYALGDVRTEMADISGVQVDYLVAFPDFEYWQEDVDTGCCRFPPCASDPRFAESE